MASSSYTFTAPVWEHDGPGGWHFVSLPRDCADEIAERVKDQASRFGSVRVEASIGATQWATSLFPDARRGTYVLPVKKAVRTAEGLLDGATARVHVVVLDASAD